MSPQARVGDEALELSLVGPPGRTERVGGLAKVESGEPSPDDALVDLGAEEDETTAVVGEPVAEGARQGLEQALAHEAAQVVGHLAGAVGGAKMVAHQLPQGSAADVGGGPAEVGQRGEEGGHPGVAEAEAGSPGALRPGRAHEGLEGRGGRHAALRLALHRDEAGVDGSADLDEGGQVRETPADPEVVGVVDVRPVRAALAPSAA